jgi:hypothetical protein
MASGPGLAGGAAGVRAAITITARDASRRRVREGGQGAEVVVTVRPAGRGGGEAIVAEVTDRGDGSYVAIYQVGGAGGWGGRGCLYGPLVVQAGAALLCVARRQLAWLHCACGQPPHHLRKILLLCLLGTRPPTRPSPPRRRQVPERGNYSVHVEVEGTEVDGSPYPVFFSAADPNAAAAAEAETADYLSKYAAPAPAPGGAAPASKAPKMIGPALGSNPTLTAPTARGAAAAAAAAAVAAAAPVAGIPTITNPAAYAAAVSAAQASSVHIPAALQAHAKALAVAKGPEGFARCVVVFQFPGASLNAEALKTIMGVTGTVKDAQVRAGRRRAAAARGRGMVDQNANATPPPHAPSTPAAPHNPPPPRPRRRPARSPPSAPSGWALWSSRPPRRRAARAT